MGEPARETLYDYFLTVSARRGEYLVYDDGYRPRRYSYADLGRAARQFAVRLEQAGVGRGDRILLWSENRPAWLAAFWGCVLRGAAVVPIDEKNSVEFATRVCSITRPKVVVLGTEVPGLEPAGALVWTLDSIDWNAESSPVAVAMTPDDTVQILFTSGATAEPKGVIITHRNILANIVPVEREIRKYLRYEWPFHPIRFLNLLPLSHMFGQAMALFIPPMIEGVVVFQRSQNPQEIVRQIRSRRVSVLVSVPKILEVLKEHIEAAEPSARQGPAQAGKFWWRWWRYRHVHRRFGMKFWSFIVGGAALDPALEEFWGRLGFAVIQGYGLTEAAPIVTLNHPFHAKRGTVGKPIAGVRIRIAGDGEILVRGGNVASGYYNNEEATRDSFEDGWLHTGDIGELDDEGRLLIKGRKKEMIVLADGRNVFPEDVERVLNGLPGVRESAAVEHDALVHAVLVLEPEASAGDLVRRANLLLEEHQKVRGYTVWPRPELPRTEGTRKLKRREIGRHVSGETPPPPEGSGMAALLSRYAGGRPLAGGTSLDELGLSSLERVELLVAVERKLGVTVDEVAFAQAKTLADLERLETAPPAAGATSAPDAPRWNRMAWAHWHRVVHLNLWLLPLTRLFAWVRVEGREHLKQLRGPVLFVSNHQGYLDAPILFIAAGWHWRLRLAPVMRKEFFDAHFHPERLGRWAWFTNSLSYYLSLLLFNCVAIPQREAGVREALRNLGEVVDDGYSPLVFPEGKHADGDEVGRFLPGAAMMAVRLGIPVVPVRIRGSNRVLHSTWRMARPGRVTVHIGTPLRLDGDDFPALARKLEDIVKEL